ncbi:hypothetical protein O181_026774 [Austropuccinia psidii MF-1]|uniref:rRNA methyltransferase 2, mitochondrial n=1 Tax=Austropuccinia psidii MF-1 TaxID=1389203 RepID=A0A9Q3H1Y3_9BASI|nr:hypothetical protein [Austropuccinia psidii MF-1]
MLSQPRIRLHHLSHFRAFERYICMASVLFKQTSSSKRFIRRALTDPYGKSRASAMGQPTYVARSAHKLIQLDQQLGLFPRRGGPTRVVDLGAAPGGWTEVVLERLNKVPCKDDKLHCVIACDLLPLDRSIRSKVSEKIKLHTIHGDFNNPIIQAEVKSHLDSVHADIKSHSQIGPTIILSDMLPPITGISIKDTQGSFDLCMAVAHLARNYIRADDPLPNVLVLKHLQSGLTEELKKSLMMDWKQVKWIKPLASRSESREGYFVVRDRKQN